jgi:hypothetical protein
MAFLRAATEEIETDFFEAPFFLLGSLFNRICSCTMPVFKQVLLRTSSSTMGVCALPRLLLECVGDGVSGTRGIAEQ